MRLLYKDNIDESTEYRISIIVQRLKGSVSFINVLKWLENFKKSEIDYALSILENLEYITEKELIEFLNDRLDKLIKLLQPKQKAYFIPIADYGKSSTLLVYYLLKSPLFQKYPHRFFVIQRVENFQREKEAGKIAKDSALILFDDFLGSGKTLINFHTEQIKPILENCQLGLNLFILCIYYLKNAELKLFKTFSNLKLIGNRKFPCFDRSQSPFKGKTRDEIRNFSYKYGINLFSTNKPHKDHPLGYHNSQALVVFPYNPPNNTLPSFLMP